MQLVRRFESIINIVLLVLICFLVLVSTLQLGEKVVAAALAPPMLRFETTDLLDIFGSFLLVLIGVELMHTVKIYLTDKRVHVEVILAVGIVAVARKVLIIEHKQIDGITILGIAALILSLSVSYYLVRLSHSKTGD
jgi:uncharacterized membrane protein (DUF373 family)